RPCHLSQGVARIRDHRPGLARRFCRLLVLSVWHCAAVLLSDDVVVQPVASAPSDAWSAAQSVARAVDLCPGCDVRALPGGSLLEGLETQATGDRGPGRHRRQPDSGVDA